MYSIIMGMDVLYKAESTAEELDKNFNITGLR